MPVDFRREPKLLSPHMSQNATSNILVDSTGSHSHPAGQDISALSWVPRKKPENPDSFSRSTDPLVHYGRHFGRTVHAMCNVQVLVTNGMIRLADDSDVPNGVLTIRARREDRVFRALLQIIPRFSEQVMELSNDECMRMADMIQKGVSSARSDDTKGLKGAVLDWITPRGVPLNPPLSRNVKSNRGFHHPTTGEYLCPAGLDWKNPEYVSLIVWKQLATNNYASVRAKLASGEMTVRGDQWPMFMYANLEYDPDDPWNGLLRNKLLVFAFKHIFTSPSSVESEVKATRSGNARIHGMKHVTTASLAYVATQLRFALSSSSVFCRSDTTTDSERFYDSVLDFLDDADEKHEVDDLLNWWDCQVFPNYAGREDAVTKNSALARLKEKRLERRAQH